MIKIPDIEKVARAATGGEWRQGRTHYSHQVIAYGYGLFPDDPGFVEYVILDGNRNFPDDSIKNVAHAASANPAAVLEMTQLIRELAGALDGLLSTEHLPVAHFDRAKPLIIAAQVREKARQAGVTDHIADVSKMVGTIDKTGG